MAGYPPSTDTLRELGAEALTVDKLAVMISRRVRTIRAAHEVWLAAHECFEASAKLWNQLPPDDLLAGHRRLLERLIQSARERCEFYSVTDHDRAIYNAGRDHGLPVENDYAETQ
jgi:hypothetical protein